mgnify:CR=1 FL=1
MNIQGNILDEAIVKEITIDIAQGTFYTDMDEETLEMALTAMWQDTDYWHDKGVILGRG